MEVNRSYERAQTRRERRISDDRTKSDLAVLRRTTSSDTIDQKQVPTGTESMEGELPGYYVNTALATRRWSTLISSETEKRELGKEKVQGHAAFYKREWSSGPLKSPVHEGPRADLRAPSAPARVLL